MGRSVDFPFLLAGSTKTLPNYLLVIRLKINAIGYKVKNLILNGDRDPFLQHNESIDPQTLLLLF
jgi:hypothetical protein